MIGLIVFHHHILSKQVCQCLLKEKKLNTQCLKGLRISKNCKVDTCIGGRNAVIWTDYCIRDFVAKMWKSGMTTV